MLFRDVNSATYHLRYSTRSSRNIRRLTYLRISPNYLTSLSFVNLFSFSWIYHVALRSPYYFSTMLRRIFINKRYRWNYHKDKVGKRKRVHVDEARDGFRIIEEHERVFDLEEGGENVEKFIKSTDLQDEIRAKSLLIAVLLIRRVKECKTKKKKKKTFAKYFASLKKSYI